MTHKTVHYQNTRINGITEWCNQIYAADVKQMWLAALKGATLPHWSSRLQSVSLKYKTAPYTFWNWGFAGSVSVVLARCSKLLLFQLWNWGKFITIRKIWSSQCLLQTFQVRTQIFLMFGISLRGCWWVATLPLGRKYIYQVAKLESCPYQEY